jgi:alkaline phosphatase
MVKFTATIISMILALGTFFGAYKAPTTGDASEYLDDNIKNVIFLIGDGMGFNHLEKTKKERNTALVMDTFEIKGSSMTRSFNRKVTDSAAGGTALSAGVRTDNSAVGVYPYDKEPEYSYPKSITELCKERGMLTGVVTTDETTGATPSAFSAHSSDRYNTEDLTADQFASGINLIWGNSNGVATKSEAQAHGYEYISTYDEMMALEEGSYSYGQFTSSLWTLEQTDENTPNLEQMAMQAIDLLDDTDEGFFLMIEGAHIDKKSHSNLSDEMTESLKEFDNTIEAVLEYAKADGETLVIVTADHETGAITLDGGEYKFTSGDHSKADVPVLVYGTDKFIANGEKLNNYEIPIRIAYTLGFSEDEFPVAVIM